MAPTATTEGEQTGDFLDGVWPVYVGWACVSIVTLITARNSFLHLANYTRPDLQPHALRIILVGPIYALSAALCLSMATNACFFVQAIRDLWEAVVIYSFLTLIVMYMGGEHLCLHAMCQREKGVPHLFPLNLCLPPIPGASMIRVPKTLALQFVIVKPVVATISIVAYAADDYDKGFYQWIVFLVYNISYSLALYALYLVYWASHDHQALQAKRPLLKFVSVKMIVFLTFWQAIILPHLPLPGSRDRWENLIVVVEMLMFAVLMNVAFSWKEFYDDTQDVRLTSAVDGFPRSTETGRSGGDLIDLGGTGTVLGEQAKVPDGLKLREAPAAATAQQARDVVRNAGAAFCPRDVLDDGIRNFSRRYQQHVLIESAQEYELDACEQGEAPVGRQGNDLLGDVSDEVASTRRGSGTLRSVRGFIGKSLAGKSSAALDPSAGADRSDETNGSSGAPDSSAGTDGKASDALDPAAVANRSDETSDCSGAPDPSAGIDARDEADSTSADCAPGSAAAAASDHGGLHEAHLPDPNTTVADPSGSAVAPACIGKSAEQQHPEPCS